jgi:hypothetical protein
MPGETTFCANALAMQATESCISSFCGLEPVWKCQGTAECQRLVVVNSLTPEWMNDDRSQPRCPKHDPTTTILTHRHTDTRVKGPRMARKSQKKKKKKKKAR